MPKACDMPINGECDAPILLPLPRITTLEPAGGHQASDKSFFFSERVGCDGNQQDISGVVELDRAERRSRHLLE